jgi:type II secretory ATPase GspE/PulE/Tfp pilus assembly ATPase PilB-like protein
VLGVLSQRLVRRLCPACRAPSRASAEQLQALAQAYCRGTKQDLPEILARWTSRFADAEGHVSLNAAVGCPRCDRSGYRGRIGVHELLVASPEVRALVQARAGTTRLFEAAAAEGMTTLVQDGIEKVLQGETDLAQVLAACQ